MDTVNGLDDGLDVRPRPTIPHLRWQLTTPRIKNLNNLCAVFYLSVTSDHHLVTSFHDLILLDRSHIARFAGPRMKASDRVWLDRGRSSF